MPHTVTLVITLAERPHTAPEQVEEYREYQRERLASYVKAHYDVASVEVGVVEDTSETAQRIEYLRAEYRADRLSYGEVIELQELAAEGKLEGDDELLEAAGVPEHPERFVVDMTRKDGSRWIRSFASEQEAESFDVEDAEEAIVESANTYVMHVEDGLECRFVDQGVRVLGVYEDGGQETAHVENEEGTSFQVPTMDLEPFYFGDDFTPQGEAA